MSSNTKLFAGLGLVVFLSLSFALWPSSAYDVESSGLRHSDSRFKVGGAFSTEKLFSLAVNLPKGALLVLNESTTHVATTRSPKLNAVLNVVRYNSALSLRMHVLSADSKAVRCRCQLLDFQYSEDTKSPSHAVNQMFQAVRRAAIGVDFNLDLVSHADELVYASLLWSFHYIFIAHTHFPLWVSLCKFKRLQMARSSTWSLPNCVDAS